MDTQSHNQTMDKSMDDSDQIQQTTSKGKKQTKGKASRNAPTVIISSQIIFQTSFNAAHMFEIESQKKAMSQTTNNNNTYETSYHEPNHIGNEETETFQFVAPNENTYQQLQQNNEDTAQQNLQAPPIQTMDQNYGQNFSVPYGLQEEFKDGEGMNMHGNQEDVRAAQTLFQNMMTQASVPTTVISTQTIAPFLKSKKNAYQIFATEGSLVFLTLQHNTICHLMMSAHLTLSVIVFLEERKYGFDIQNVQCFKNSQIRLIKVPKLEELTAKKIMDQIANDDTIQLFLPDLDRLKRPLNREYLFNIINTVKPGYFESNIPHAYKVRKENAEAKKLQMIEICQEMLEAIQNSNQRVSNNGNGRALAMLTVGSKDKRRKREKPQKPKYEPLVPLGQVDSIQEYMDAMDFGTPRQFKRAKRHYINNGNNKQGFYGGNGGQHDMGNNMENNNPNNDFIMINQGFSGQASISGGSKAHQSLDYSATTTKSRFTVEGGKGINQFQFDPSKVGYSKVNPSSNVSGFSATSQAQPQIQQRRVL